MRILAKRDNSPKKDSTSTRGGYLLIWAGGGGGGEVGVGWGMEGKREREGKRETDRQTQTVS